MSCPHCSLFHQLKEHPPMQLLCGLNHAGICELHGLMLIVSWVLKRCPPSVCPLFQHTYLSLLHKQFLGPPLLLVQGGPDLWYLGIYHLYNSLCELVKPGIELNLTAYTSSHFELTKYDHQPISYHVPLCCLLVQPGGLSLAHWSCFQQGDDLHVIHSVQLLRWGHAAFNDSPTQGGGD